MRFGRLTLAAVAAASMLTAPVMAESLSPSAKAIGTSKVKRAGAPVTKENKLGGGNGTIIAIVAAAAVILGIVLISGNDDDNPTSP
jgi:hypothetical protein